MIFASLKGKIRTLIAKRLYSLFSHDISQIRLRIGQQSLLSSKLLRGKFQRLSDAEITVYSQWGEDGILDYLCDVVSLERPHIFELGAGNFLECNSRFLIENRFASSVLVDARADLISTAKNDGVYWKTHMMAICEWITPSSVRNIQKTAREFLGHIDIISIDIDGNDFWVMTQIDLSEVKIVVAEYNPLFGINYPVSIPRDDSFSRESAHHSNLYYGVGLKAWVEYFSNLGFGFAGTNKVGSNAFFVKKAFIGGLDFSPAEDLSTYVNWSVRESRDTNGELDFLSGSQRLAEIGHLELVDVFTGKTLMVSEVNGL